MGADRRPAPTLGRDRGASGARQRDARRVHRRPARRQLLDLRGRAARPVGYARVVPLRRDGGAHRADGAARATRAAGIGRALLERCWPGDPDARPRPRWSWRPARPRDLSLYSDFGVMPVAGHWHLRARTAEYPERRSQEIDATEPGVHALEAEPRGRRVEALEPPGDRPPAPDAARVLRRTAPAWRRWTRARRRATGALLGRDRAATSGRRWRRRPRTSCRSCWPRSTAWPRPRSPTILSVFCATDSWWLLRRLRSLGFRVYWPSWVMARCRCRGSTATCPTRPPHLL